MLATAIRHQKQRFYSLSKQLSASPVSQQGFRPLACMATASSARFQTTCLHGHS